MHSRSIIQRPVKRIQQYTPDSEFVVFRETNGHGATDIVLGEIAMSFFTHNVLNGLPSDEVPSNTFQRDEIIE